MWRRRWKWGFIADRSTLSGVVTIEKVHLDPGGQDPFPWRPHPDRPRRSVPGPLESRLASSHRAVRSGRGRRRAVPQGSRDAAGAHGRRHAVTREGCRSSAKTGNAAGLRGREAASGVSGRGRGDGSHSHDLEDPHVGVGSGGEVRGRSRPGVPTPPPYIPRRLSPTPFRWAFAATVSAEVREPRVVPSTDAPRC
jgi:hypothetical protein